MWTMSVQSITPGRVPILLTKVEPEDGRLLLAKHSVDMATGLRRRVWGGLGSPRRPELQ